MKKLSYDKSDKSSTASAIIKILSNKNRYLMMKLILNAKNDYCVHELSEAVGISQSATSHQLAYLEARGAVRSVRTGKTKCYLPTNSPLAKKLSKVVNFLK